MAKRFILFGDDTPGNPIETVASDCAAVYALNGRFSSDDEVREELLSYGMPTVTHNDISMVRAKFNQIRSATDADVEDVHLLSEDELVALIVASRDRRPAVPLIVDYGSTEDDQSI